MLEEHAGYFTAAYSNNTYAIVCWRSTILVRLLLQRNLPAVYTFSLSPFSIWFHEEKKTLWMNKMEERASYFL